LDQSLLDEEQTDCTFHSYCVLALSPEKSALVPFILPSVHEDSPVCLALTLYEFAPDTTFQLSVAWFEVIFEVDNPVGVAHDSSPPDVEIVNELLLSSDRLP
jgi:hypothetical protein